MISFVKPAGYVTNEEVVNLDTKYQGQDVKTAVYNSEYKNAPTTFEFTKTDITSGAELTGATLTVLDKDGNVEDGSKEKQHENYKDWSEYREGSFVWADMIKRDLDACILQANDFSGFLELLSEKGYEVKQGKYLAVRPQGMTRFRRCKTLGENYSQEAIVERIAKEDLPSLIQPRIISFTMSRIVW